MSSIYSRTEYAAFRSDPQKTLTNRVRWLEGLPPVSEDYKNPLLFLKSSKESSSFMRMMLSTLSLPGGSQLAVTVLLAIVPFIPATSSLTVVQRDEPMDSPEWPFLGCYMDSPEKRALATTLYADVSNLTVENCVNSCKSQNYTYAGVENGDDCFCGNMLTFGAEGIPQSQCSSPCAGNSNETCGGPDHLDLYWSGAPLAFSPPSLPTFVPNVDTWYFYGCFK
ncbi:WSC domain-containing protein [Lactarius quietus]|nr:WSC domain-containing protein [Lactarius quietus]